MFLKARWVALAVLLMTSILAVRAVVTRFEQGQLDQNALAAIRVGDVPALRRSILQGASPNAVVDYEVSGHHHRRMKMSLLSWAVFFSQYDACVVLLQSGADPNPAWLPPMLWLSDAPPNDRIRMLIAKHGGKAVDP